MGEVSYNCILLIQIFIPKYRFYRPCIQILSELTVASLTLFLNNLISLKADTSDCINLRFFSIFVTVNQTVQLNLEIGILVHSYCVFSSPLTLKNVRDHFMDLSIKLSHI